MSEAAFLVMDFLDRGAASLAWLFLDAYLQAGGDYAGLAVLRFYLVYRAVVRAKVHLIRARQPALDAAEAERLTRVYREYVSLARRCGGFGTPALVLMHGFSGSGKSTIAACLVAALGAVCIRSDVERKRLHGLTALARSGSALGAGLYARGATRNTYSRLADAAAAVVDAGLTAIVDATFLERAQRLRFQELAQARGIALVLVDVQAPSAVLRSRVAARAGDPSEATIEVLEHQLATADPITEEEGLTTVRTAGASAYTGALAAELERALAGAIRHAGEKKTPPRSGTAS